MLLSIGTLIVVAYLVLSINVYLESFAFDRFSIGYGYVGPTEIRLILIALNTALVLGGGLDFTVASLELTVARPDRPRDRLGDAAVARRPGLAQLRELSRSNRRLRGAAERLSRDFFPQIAETRPAPPGIVI